MRLSLLAFVQALFTPRVLAQGACSADGRPNIVFIFTDDQDRRLGSTDYQPILQRELAAKGTEFINHFSTVAQCCPSRSSLFRGQAAHNTNITNVSGAGGNYNKWLASGEHEDYLPFWLKNAGYRTEYLGKFLNGYDRYIYQTAPGGWDHVDAFMDPFTYAYNCVVMTENGARPKLYQGFHQTDVIRTKALARLEYLTSQSNPFYLTIAPTSPHVQTNPNANATPPVPLARHAEEFMDAQVPRSPNFNTESDEIQAQHGGWLKDIARLNDSQVAHHDEHYRARLRALQGIDEIIEDVVNLLEEKGCLENTYILYTTDNGYHMGNHRAVAAKALPYIEDSNLPFYIRGPGVPAGVKSKLPSAHLDLAPTFLEIAGLPKEHIPVFLDGRSLLGDWKNPTGDWEGAGSGIGKEILDVEFWGGFPEEEWPFDRRPTNSYKTVRLVAEDESWLFTKWCSGEKELYNTKDDPYELQNMVSSTDSTTVRVVNRLNALLLVTKSCSEETCRNPWSVLQPSNGTITSLKDALEENYDTFFEDFPEVAFKECIDHQSVGNEMPFFPPESANLQSQYRKNTDNFYNPANGRYGVPQNEKLEGGPEQRHVTIEEIMAKARELTDEELAIE